MSEPQHFYYSAEGVATLNLFLKKLQDRGISILKEPGAEELSQVLNGATENVVVTSEGTLEDGREVLELILDAKAFETVEEAFGPFQNEMTKNQYFIG